MKFCFEEILLWNLNESFGSKVLSSNMVNTAKFMKLTNSALLE